MVSLIDVMMLLLVIFMITAPLMQGGVDVKLPEAQAQPLEDKSSMVVSIDTRGRIFVDRDGMSYGEFRGSFKGLVGGNADRGVTLKADRGASWEVVAQVLSVIRGAGVTKLGIMLDMEPPG